MAKRSFFERLTGATPVDEEMDEQEVSITPRNIRDVRNTRVTDSRDDRDFHHGGEKHLVVTGDIGNEGWQEEESEGQLTVDVHQTPSDIVIRTMVAGVKPDDLEINITRDMVTIKGKRDATREVSDEDYFFRELYWGTFSRTILLPQEIESENAEATEKFGLLTIRLPKIDKGRQTKLKVKSMN